MPARTSEWWLWLATVTLLATGLLMDRSALIGAILVAAVQVPLMAKRHGGLTSFAAQVRITYLCLLLLGLWDPLAIVHWIQLVGTLVVVLTDYCFLARCLSLLPANRRLPLTARLVARTFFSRPAASIVRRD